MSDSAQQDKPKHTPGPWNYATSRSSICGQPVVAQSGRVICDMAGVPKGFPNEDKINAENMANAALIAAAPELSEAAKAAVAYDDALQSCANDPEKMASFCTAEDETLDSLYAAWIGKSRAALAKAGAA